MAQLSQDDIETLRMVATYGEALTYAEIGAMLPEGIGLRSERRKSIGARRCRTLLEGGALKMSGHHKIDLTEKGRLALGLVMGKEAMTKLKAELATETRA